MTIIDARDVLNQAAYQDSFWWVIESLDGKFLHGLRRHTYELTTFTEAEAIEEALSLAGAAVN